MAERPTILLTNPVHVDAIAMLEPVVDLVTAPDTTEATLRAMARDVDGIIVRARLPDDILDHAPRVRGLVRHGVGLDFIPVAAATARGVAVANLPGCNTQAVAEYVLAALLHLRRQVATLDATLRHGGWARGKALADGTGEIGGSTLGIVGVGTIGSRVAGMARLGFGMDVLGTTRRPGSLPDGVSETAIEALFARSDAVVVACALTPETSGLVSADLIARMKPNAVLINVSRGPVIETQALLDALHAGRIAGAALDVFDVQPLPEDSPLLSCPGLLLTPHVAGITATSSRAMSVGAASEMLRIIRGERPQNFVNPAAWPSHTAE